MSKSSPNIDKQYKLPCSLKGQIVVDARARGTQARFVRRSCRPNCTIEHMLHRGHLYLVLVTTDNVPQHTELTLPHNNDYRSSRFPVDCVCAKENEKCPIREYNAQLPPPPSPLKKIAKMQTQGGTGRGPGRPPGRKSAPAVAGRGKSPKGTSSAKKIATRTPKSAKAAAYAKKRAKLFKKVSPAKLKLTPKKPQRKTVQRQSESTATNIVNEEQKDDERRPSVRRATVVIARQQSPKASNEKRKTMSPEVISSPDRQLSREEKKALQVEEMFRRMEEKEKEKERRKGEGGYKRTGDRQTETPKARVGRPPMRKEPVPKKPIIIERVQKTGKTAKEAAAEASQSRRQSTRRTSLTLSRRDEDEIKSESESSLSDEDVPRRGTRQSQRTASPAAVSSSPSKSRQPPRKRWSQAAGEHEEEPKPSTSTAARAKPGSMLFSTF